MPITGLSARARRASSGNHHETYSDSITSDDRRRNPSDEILPRCAKHGITLRHLIRRKSPTSTELVITIAPGEKSYHLRISVTRTYITFQPSKSVNRRRLIDVEFGVVQAAPHFQFAAKLRPKVTCPLGGFAFPSLFGRQVRGEDPHRKFQDERAAFVGADQLFLPSRSETERAHKEKGVGEGC